MFFAYGNLVGSSESSGNARALRGSAFGAARPNGNIVGSPSRQILTQSSACLAVSAPSIKGRCAARSGSLSVNIFEPTSKLRSWQA